MGSEDDGNRKCCWFFRVSATALLNMNTLVRPSGHSLTFPGPTLIFVLVIASANDTAFIFLKFTGL